MDEEDITSNLLVVYVYTRKFVVPMIYTSMSIINFGTVFDTNTVICISKYVTG